MLEGKLVVNVSACLHGDVCRDVFAGVGKVYETGNVEGNGISFSCGVSVICTCGIQGPFEAVVGGTYFPSGVNGAGKGCRCAASGRSSEGIELVFVSFVEKNGNLVSVAP